MPSINQATPSQLADPHTQMQKLPQVSPGKRPLAEGVRVAVPDFRNLGALMRMLVLVNIVLFVTEFIHAESLHNFLPEWVLLAVKIQLPLIVIAGVLYLLSTWLMHLTWRELTVVIVCLSLFVCVLVHVLGMFAGGRDAHIRHLAWSAFSAIAVVLYFRWRQIEQIPALDEARILALTARIRPHFFFNSLNGVLGVIRSDPRRAEQALESLAELFRELMKDNRDLVTLCDEIDLCNRYLELERLRLGDRLKVNWELKYAPLNAKVPPLMLQPLIENAVYHGIEPSMEPGTIHIGIVRKGRALEIGISNPATSNARRSAGNRMALNNIRERLALFFDLEAALTTEERDGQFRVRIRMPLRKDEK